MRIKLFSLYVGELPAYVWDFEARLGDFSSVDWELIHFDHIAGANQLFSQRLGVPCNKQTGYALSDARPMLAEMFPNEVKGYDWWGWSELDVVLGDLDNLLPPLMERHDAISAFDTAVSGPLMLFRNCRECNNLFRKGNWQEVLKEPTYCNFEEVQRGTGGLTVLLEESGLRVHWDDRYSLQWAEDPSTTTPASCVVDGKRLIEVPTGRELLIYHFNHLKVWPNGDVNQESMR